MKDKDARKEIESLKEKISDLTAKPTLDLVDCEVCKCAIRRENATKGEGEVRQRDLYSTIALSYLLPLPPITQDYIYYPYYCEIHKPKAKK